MPEQCDDTQRCRKVVFAQGADGVWEEVTEPDSDDAFEYIAEKSDQAGFFAEDSDRVCCARVAAPLRADIDSVELPDKISGGD